MGAHVKALVVAGAVVLAGGIGVGGAFAAGDGASGHTGTAPAAQPVTQGAHTAATSSTTPVPAPATSPAVSPLPTTTTVPAPAPASAPPWAASSSANSVAGSDGSLSATLTASTVKGTVGTAIDFTVVVHDTASTGPEGLQWIHYGDGSPSGPATGFAATSKDCTAPASAASTDDLQHTYGAPGTYTVSILVQAPCSSEQVTLNLPVTVG